MTFKELWTTVFIKEMSMNAEVDTTACAKVADKAIEEYKKRCEQLAIDDVDMSIKNQLYIYDATEIANEKRCNVPGCMVHDPENKKSKISDSEPSGKRHCGDPDKCRVEPYSEDICDCCCSRCGPWTDWKERQNRETH